MTGRGQALLERRLVEALVKAHAAARVPFIRGLQLSRRLGCAGARPALIPPLSLIATVALS